MCATPCLTKQNVTRENDYKLINALPPVGIESGRVKACKQKIGSNADFVATLFGTEVASDILKIPCSDLDPPDGEMWHYMINLLTWKLCNNWIPVKENLACRHITIAVEMTRDHWTRVDEV